MKLSTRTDLSGFTLSETLLAAAVSAVVIAAASVALARAFNLYGRVTASGGSDRIDFLKAYSCAAADITSALPPFRGDSRSLEFRRLYSPDPAAAPADIADVSVRLHPSGGTQRTLTHRATGEELGNGVFQAVGFEFAAFSENGDPEWMDEWSDTNSLPAHVRCSLGGKTFVVSPAAAPRRTGGGPE